MKKLFTILMVLFISQMAHSQDVVLAKWSFPSGNLSDTMVEQSNEQNAGVFINTLGGTGAISMKNGASTKAAQAEGWDNGQESKAWQVFLNTIGFQNIRLSSKQQSGNTNPGPRDWKVQVKIGDDGVWTDVENGTYTVMNDWTTGAVDALILPSTCEDQGKVVVRWVMTSNLDINGATVLQTGTTKIDDILLVGTVLSGLSEQEYQSQLRIFPNPAHHQFNIESSEPIQKLEIINLTGMVSLSSSPGQSYFSWTGELAPGIYVVKAYSPHHVLPAIQKLVVR